MLQPNAGVARCPHVAASAPLPARSRRCTPHAVTGRRRPKSPLTPQLARPAGPLECAPPALTKSKNGHTMTLRSTVTSARNCENDLDERDWDDGGDDIYEDTEARVFTERGTSHGWVMVAKICTSWSLSMEKARAVQKHCANWQWKTTWDDVLLARLHTSQFSTD
ncbi:hypothetical protein U9M48_004488 [Paspalum notatum var. saurae]|uniref:Uncharacterized protein n=1 Tax=Paspalum notatum var. saurae TaxID=547442 RepID=A0AAQ3SKT0_PASNO